MIQIACYIYNFTIAKISWIVLYIWDEPAHQSALLYVISLIQSFHNIHSLMSLINAYFVIAIGVS